ncbi:hypothetical protein SLA2020_501810 [Shorea laevis]
MYRLDAFVIVEPRISGEAANKQISKLNFSSFTKVDAQGFSGGIWVLWNGSIGEVFVLESTAQMITVLVKCPHLEPWIFSAVYASPTPSVREQLWNKIEQLDCFDHMPWLLVGDFNQITSSNERLDGLVTGLRGASKMLECFQARELIDLGASGSRFTWTNKQHGGNLVMKRLDRALANVPWRLLFPEAFVRNLPRTRGDHCPVLINIKGLPPPSKESRPFRFEAAWLSHPNFKTMLEKAWNEGTSLENAINSFTTSVKRWNQEVFGDIFKRKRRLLARIIGTQKEIENCPRPSLFALEDRLIKSYNAVLNQEELLWLQKSRSNWVQFGDQNTRFFHTTTIIKRRSQRITALKRTDNTWCTDPKELRDMVVEYFKDLYQAPVEIANPTSVMDFLRNGHMDENQLLTILRPISNEEIKDAIFSMSAYKAPGSDGLQPVFYQLNWSIVSDRLYEFVKTAFQEGSFERSLNDTLICIIPKMAQPEKLNQLRPIGLCNVAVKAITKVMVNRLRPILVDILSPTQSAFIPGKGCHDNIVIVQEAIHSLKKCKGKVGNFIMKIDLEKAYDRISWDFLRWVLQDLGLPSNWISLIMFCTTTSEFSLLWNGEKTTPFTPTRGLRQGDPLSPYLFVLCLDRLSQLIENDVQSKKWSPFRITRKGPFLSHVFFADDLILFGKATVENANTLMSCLDRFCSISGQKVNPQKSKILFSPNSDCNTISEICRVTGMAATDELGRYLGVQIEGKRLTRKSFHDLVTKIHDRLSSWKAKQLSFAGRQVLIQLVSSTMANHTMQTTKLPVSICQEIDKANRNFLWGGAGGHRKLSLVSWERVCMPKSFGGLGVRSTSFMNQAFLAKLGWRILTEPDALWVQVVKAKYFPNCGFLEAEYKAGSSHTWKGIIESKSLVQAGIGFVVSNGVNTRFWLDSWLLDHPLFFSAVNVIPEPELQKSMADYWMGTHWDTSLLRHLLPTEIMNQLLLVQLESDNTDQDGIYWSEASHGKFSTSSAYNMVINDNCVPIASCWNKIWKIKAAPKEKGLLWLMLHNRVLTNSSRMARGLTNDDSCPRCQHGREDVLHCFRDCEGSRRLWRKWIGDNLWQRWQQMNHAEWINHNLSRTNVKIEQGLPWDVAFAAICWFIWLARNKAVFEGDREWIVAKEGMLRFHLAKAGYFLNRNPPTGTLRYEQLVGWEKPPPGYVKINVDGSARGTPGASAAGGVCRDSNGDWCFGFTQQLGMGIAIRAELYALWKGLQLAWEKGYKKVIIETDSLLAKQKLEQHGGVANSLSMLCRGCTELLNRNWDCKLRHVFREANSCADVMASSFYHLEPRLHFFEEPPDEVKTTLREDLLGVCKPRASRLFSA